MAATFVFGKNTATCEKLDLISLKKFPSKVWNIGPADFYLLCQGKLVKSDVVPSSTIHVVPRLTGGKGGFGSMLRAIGAQIEKTTNREACRDLSGRRLRDINEEKRLKNWINQQSEREKEAKDRKQKKLERLCQEPKYEFKDEDYINERATLPDKIEDAVTQGMKASCSTKRAAEEPKKNLKKKPKLWVDADLDDLSSSEDESASNDGKSTVQNPESDNSSQSSNKNEVESTSEGSKTEAVILEEDVTSENLESPSSSLNKQEIKD